MVALHRPASIASKAYRAATYRPPAEALARTSPLSGVCMWIRYNGLTGKVSHVPRNGFQIRDKHVKLSQNPRFHAILNCPVSERRFRYNGLTGKVLYVPKNRLQIHDQRVELSQKPRFHAILNCPVSACTRWIIDPHANIWT